MEQLERRDLLAVGELEPLFGDNGVVEDGVPVKVFSSDRIVHTNVDSASKLTVVSSTSNGHGSVGVVTRFSPDGSLDEAFGDSGRVFLPLGVDGVTILDAVSNSFDQVTLVGTSLNGSLLAMLDSSGRLDPNFDEDGILYIDRQYTAITLAQNGDVLVTGAATGHNAGVYVDRFRTDGSRVNEFGEQGTARRSSTLDDLYARDIIAADDGSIVVGVTGMSGNDQVDLRLIRFDDAGTIDGSYGNAGAVSFPLIIGSDFFNEKIELATATEGRVVAAFVQLSVGDFTRDYTLTAARVDADGQADTTFSGDGLVQFSSLEEDSQLLGVSIGAEDSVTVAVMIGRGDSSGPVRVNVSRILADGEIDTNFGTGGSLEFTTPVQLSYRLGDVVNRNGGGVTVAYTDNTGFTTAWLNGEGQLDPLVGEAGSTHTISVPEQTRTEVERSVALLDGRLLVLESSFGVNGAVDSDYALRRYWADGSLDTDYGEDGRWSLPSPPCQQLTEFSCVRFTYTAELVPAVDGAFVYVDSFHENKALLGRLIADGELDETYGVNGWVTLDYGSWMTDLYSVTPWGSSQTLVFGQDKSQGRYVGFVVDDSGEIDIDFGDEGFLHVDKFNSFDDANVCTHADLSTTVLLRNVKDQPQLSVVLRRFDQSGSRQTAYGDGGDILLPFSVNRLGHSRQLICLPNGETIVAGTVRREELGSLDSRVFVGRYDAAGAPDPSFGDSGSIIHEIGMTHDRIVALEVDSHGRIILGVQSQDRLDDYAVARLQPDGVLDHSFGINGITKLDLHGYGDYLASVDTAPNGDLILAGHTKDGVETRLALARLQGDRDIPVWQNANDQNDVNGDASVSPLDALIVINFLNDGTHPSELPPYRDTRVAKDHVDVTGDGHVSPLDALLIINVLNSAQNGFSEAEGHVSRSNSPTIHNSRPIAFSLSEEKAGRATASTNWQPSSTSFDRPVEFLSSLHDKDTQRIDQELFDLAIDDLFRESQSALFDDLLHALNDFDAC